MWTHRRKTFENHPEKYRRELFFIVDDTHVFIEINNSVAIKKT